LDSLSDPDLPCSLLFAFFAGVPSFFSYVDSLAHSLPVHSLLRTPELSCSRSKLVDASSSLRQPVSSSPSGACVLFSFESSGVDVPLIRQLALRPSLPFFFDRTCKNVPPGLSSRVAQLYRRSRPHFRMSILALPALLFRDSDPLRM